MVSINELKFNEKGLIPAIVADRVSREVLMQAWMSKESLEKTMETGLACFFSRSRNALWVKGETSGNYLHVISVTADCDRDSLLIVASPDGPACHLGTKSCFSYPLWESSELEDFTYEGLYALLEGRKKDLPEGGYTTYLFQKGTDKILKKIGEESTEVIIAGKAEDRAETIYEIADLAYHVMVLMVQQNITLEVVYKELASRHVIDHKVKQEKMTGGNG